MVCIWLEDQGEKSELFRKTTWKNRPVYSEEHFLKIKKKIVVTHIHNMAKKTTRLYLYNQIEIAQTFNNVIPRGEVTNCYLFIGWWLLFSFHFFLKCQA